jgi:hypothetical protein
MGGRATGAQARAGRESYPWKDMITYYKSVWRMAGLAATREWLRMILSVPRRVVKVARTRLVLAWSGRKARGET